MYEFHGWANIRETYRNTEEAEMNIRTIIDKINQYIKSQEMFNWSFDIKTYNGNHHLIVSGFTNHALPASKKLFDLYKYIANIAPGSYGLLYIHDDEDINGFENEFRVFVLARGELIEKKDMFLSPYIPTVEDEYDM